MTSSGALRFSIKDRQKPSKTVRNRQKPHRVAATYLTFKTPSIRPDRGFLFVKCVVRFCADFLFQNRTSRCGARRDAVWI